ncbi:MAG TPA: polymer-forming cytoskeletal protein [Thermoanaerobaculia bacterium]|nr:polymer-forming cytoskeletal protein [Thermoanaerobaculia bacterium]
MIFKAEGNQADLNGFVDRGSLLEGQLRFESQFRVDGRIQGGVTSQGRLIVGEHGEVEAEVNVGEVLVSGVIRGTVTASRKVHIAAGGKIYGDVVTPALVIDDGAIFEGRCAMNREEARPEAAAKKGERGSTGHDKAV